MQGKWRERERTKIGESEVRCATFDFVLSKIHYCKVFFTLKKLMILFSKDAFNY